MIARKDAKAPFNLASLRLCEKQKINYANSNKNQIRPDQI